MEIDISLSKSSFTTVLVVNAFFWYIFLFQQKSPLTSPVKQVSLSVQDKVDEEFPALVSEEVEGDEHDDQSELAKEEKVLTKHLLSIHREKLVASHLFLFVSCTGTLCSFFILFLK